MRAYAVFKIELGHHALIEVVSEGGWSQILPRTGSKVFARVKHAAFGPRELVASTFLLARVDKGRLWVHEGNWVAVILGARDPLVRHSLHHRGFGVHVVLYHWTRNSRRNRVVCPRPWAIADLENYRIITPVILTMFGPTGSHCVFVLPRKLAAELDIRVCSCSVAAWAWL